MSARLESAERRSEELAEQLRRTEGQHEAEAEANRVALGRATAAELAATHVEHRRAEAAAEAQEAKDQAQDAENRAWESETRAKEAEARAMEAEARAALAVEEYKASAAFVQEVTKASLDAYAHGFGVCKAKVAAALNINISDLDAIQPGGFDDEEEEAEAEATGAEKAGDSEAADEEAPKPAEP